MEVIRSSEMSVLIGPTRHKIPEDGINQTKTNSVAFGPQSNYRQSGRRLLAKLVPNVRVEDVTWSAQRIPTAVNLGFLVRSSYFLILVAPQLPSRG
jgi:hypothetical protein